LGSFIRRKKPLSHRFGVKGSIFVQRTVDEDTSRQDNGGKDR